MRAPLGPIGEDPAHDAEFDLEDTALWQIREAVRALLAPRTGVVVEDAVLVADELVTNAIEHGQPPRRVRFRVQPRPQRLRVEVDDCGPGVPYLRTADDSGGRGMTVIDSLATEWGVIDYTRFKTVWAELPLDRPRVPPMSTMPPTDQP
ncbi:ATP-binding protein [Nocardia wallacei]|uniref:Histidine kinase/HSP90-like ATPase domain-containing protein n=1 Tax=Nocardia wallacei TaxID=480035 RepID=A0A7G1KPD2_9NOCA|nr:ATP-binding protein [Nocardia wallacei]BCK56093.1 hypothetical protein NWFMUON74_38650 [Nocardia wallacei]